MGSNTLTNVSNTSTTSADQFNQYNTALKGDLVPRNSSGIAENGSASLGTPSIKWLKSFIEAGCWDIGDLKPHHTYNGLADIGQGWYPCDGTVINKTNYDAIFGNGSWNAYIIDSTLENKYSPDLVSKYLIGSSATTEDGTAPIAIVGNSNNESDLTHTHVTSGHKHQWREGTSSTGALVNNTAVGDAQIYNSSGGLINYAAGIDGHSTFRAPITESSLSATTDIQPESIEIIYYIRIA